MALKTGRSLDKFVQRCVRTIFLLSVVVFRSRERMNNNLQACASILISDNNYRIDDVTSICVFSGEDLWWTNTELI